MRRLALSIAVVIGLALGAAWGANTLITYAQTDENPCVSDATPEATQQQQAPSGQRLLGQADYSSLPDAPARMTTTQITLAPGASTQPFVTLGPTLIIVQEGTIVFTADEAAISQVPQPSLGGIAVEGGSATPVPADGVEVPRGMQIALNGGVNAQMANTGADGVRLMLVMLAPGAA